MANDPSQEQHSAFVWPPRPTVAPPIVPAQRWTLLHWCLFCISFHIFASALFFGGFVGANAYVIWLDGTPWHESWTHLAVGSLMAPFMLWSVFFAFLYMIRRGSKRLAAREGRDENTLADALLTEALEAANRDRSIDRSWEIYFLLRPQIETPENIGRLILLDLNSGDYEIADDELGFNAVAALRERHPDAHAFGMRIGYKTSASFCGDLERLPE